jgi:glucokinase
MATKWYAGIDIGGTKSAVLLISDKGEIARREEIPTTKGKNNWQPTVDFIKNTLVDFTQHQKVSAAGISCGGPLDSKKGLILSPPNLARLG